MKRRERLCVCYAEPSERDEEESIVDRNGNDLGKEIVCVCV